MIDKVEQDIISFFEGDLPKEQEDVFRQNPSEEVRLLFQQYEALYADLGNQEIVSPSENLKKNFHQFLENEKQRVIPSQESRIRRLKSNNFLYTAAAIGLLVIGMCVGLIIAKNASIQGMNNELAELRAGMNELLRDKSTSVRIKAVSMSYEIEQPDEEIIKALTNTMNNDDSQNVRLAAVNALGKFAQEESVKQELISSLESQKNSFIQIKIIHILSNIKAREALPIFDKIIKQEDALQFVKDEAIEGKSIISSI